MDHLSDFMQLTQVTSARTCTRSCYERFMQPNPEQAEQQRALGDFLPEISYVPPDD